MKDRILYKVTCRSESDSIWVREEVFFGTLSEFIDKFGSKKQNPLKPFRRRGKLYVFYFSEFQDGFWHVCRDPRDE
jgi:hypothetical protein